MRKTIWAAGAIYLAGTATGGGAESATSAQVLKLLSQAACHDQAAQVLKRWYAKDFWIAEPPGQNGESIFRVPTQRIGVWVKATFFPNRAVTLDRLTADTRTGVAWRESCEPRLRVQTARKPASLASAAAAGLTDRELARIVESGKPGIIFAWSPQMPLSVKGYPEAKRLAERLGVRFVPVLDPMTDAKAAAKEARKHGIDAAAVRPIRSLELMARGMGLHYPSMLVFSHGAIADSLFPGYSEQAQVLEGYVKKWTQ